MFEGVFERDGSERCPYHPRDERGRPALTELNSGSLDAQDSVARQQGDSQRLQASLGTRCAAWLRRLALALARRLLLEGLDDVRHLRCMARGRVGAPGCGGCGFCSRCCSRRGLGHLASRVARSRCAPASALVSSVEPAGRPSVLSQQLSKRGSLQRWRRTAATAPLALSNQQQLSNRRSCQAGMGRTGETRQRCRGGEQSQAKAHVGVESLGGPNRLRRAEAGHLLRGDRHHSAKAAANHFKVSGLRCQHCRGLCLERGEQGRSDVRALQLRVQLPQLSAHGRQAKLRCPSHKRGAHRLAVHPTGSAHVPGKRGCRRCLGDGAARAGRERRVDGSRNAERRLGRGCCRAR
mmetsp:Transcript_3405/g.14030  ORF Transcript_3405/g.14030 Transcript_3405/m.14030 type:complete len:351 (+) Transcript_3405:3092-4144(+)